MLKPKTLFRTSARRIWARLPTNLKPHVRRLLGRFANRTPQRSLADVLDADYVEHHRNTPVQPDLVLWESHEGSGMVCHPYAIFKRFTSHDDFHRHQHVWVINDGRERKILGSRFQHLPNLSFVERNSSEYRRCLATAGMIIGNTSLHPSFSKRPGQRIVNTWHSLTVKTLGKDLPNGQLIGRNIMRSLLATDILISPNSWMTKILLDSYQVRSIFSGVVLEEGSPRSDLLNTPLAEVADRLAEHDLKLHPEKKIVLYAPTWRGQIGNINDDLDVIETTLGQLETSLPPDQYQILVKPHHLTYARLVKAGADTSRLVPPTVDPNELLSAVDILITDYSSIFFDFLPTGRPIFFYLHDLASYSKERGIYFPPDELPGPSTDNLQTLCRWLRDIESAVAPFAKNYAHLTSWAGPNDDGQVSSRMLEIIFGNAESPRVADLPADNRTKVLFYAGGFKQNGVLASLVTLMKHIDHSKLDITLHFMNPAKRDEKFVASTLNELPSSVRALIRCGRRTNLPSEESAIGRLAAGEIPHADIVKDPDLTAAAEREFRRCFGDTSFDYVVDYSGYGTYFPLVFTQAGDAKRIIWQHTDIASNHSDTSKRALPQYETGSAASALRELYESFDAMVSCSEEVMLVNRAKLASPTTFDRFTVVTNLVDQSRVKAGVETLYCLPDNGERVGLVVRDGLATPESGPETLESVGFNYADTLPGNRTGIGVQFKNVPLPIADEINFVTMGRYSPEKNHEELIRAFRDFHEETPASRLYLIGGGTLRERYLALADELELGDRVVLTGILSNPFGLMSLCDCFVLPSFYEGMGLAVLEARIVGLPIVMTEFDAAGSVSLPNGQFTTGHSAAELLRGLRAFRDGLVPAALPYDATTHNTIGLEEFYRLLK